MPTYTITFTLNSNVELDTSRVLDGADAVTGILAGAVETCATDFEWQRCTIDDGDICVEEVEEVETFVEGDRLQLDVAGHKVWEHLVWGDGPVLLEVRFLRYLPGQQEALVTYSGLTLQMPTSRLSMWSAQ